MIYTADVVHQIGSDIACKRQNSKLLHLRKFVAFYGRTPEEVSELWSICSPEMVPKPKVIHLFWCLMYMKLYLPMDVMCTLLDTAIATFNKWVWLWIEAISMLHVDIIRWEKRNRNVLDRNIWCKVSVDGTDFRIGEPMPFDRRWKSPKAAGASVKYEVAISIYSGDIVWIYGPHVGSKHDLAIFREKLKDMLDENEMVEADAGYAYRGAASDGIIRSRDDYNTKEEKQEKSEVRARHETCNRRFKVWGILKQQFRNDRKKHQLVFYAIAVMTQMSIDNGDVLFGCEPLTEKQEEYHI
jgi:hypothetical protein